MIMAGIDIVTILVTIIFVSLAIEFLLELFDIF